MIAGKLSTRWELIKEAWVEKSACDRIICEEVAHLNPDVVIVVTGVLPEVLRIPDFDKPLVTNAKKALRVNRQAKPLGSSAARMAA